MKLLVTIKVIGTALKSVLAEWLEKRGFRMKAAPAAGDIINLNFDPRSGIGIPKYRLALVIIEQFF